MSIFNRKPENNQIRTNSNTILEEAGLPARKSEYIRQFNPQGEQTMTDQSSVKKINKLGAMSVEQILVATPTFADYKFRLNPNARYVAATFAELAAVGAAYARFTSSVTDGTKQYPLYSFVKVANMAYWYKKNGADVYDKNYDMTVIRDNSNDRTIRTFIQTTSFAGVIDGSRSITEIKLDDNYYQGIQGDIRFAIKQVEEGIKFYVIGYDKMGQHKANAMINYIADRFDAKLCFAGGEQRKDAMGGTVTVNKRFSVLFTNGLPAELMALLTDAQYSKWTFLAKALDGGFQFAIDPKLGNEAFEAIVYGYRVELASIYGMYEEVTQKLVRPTHANQGILWDAVKEGYAVIAEARKQNKADRAEYSAHRDVAMMSAMGTPEWVSAEQALVTVFGAPTMMHLMTNNVSQYNTMVFNKMKSMLLNS